MPGENIWDWSTTAANNGAADSGIGWAEGQTRASVNDSARGMMAAVAKWRNLNNGSITTGGSANAQTVTSGMSFTSIPTGMRILVKNGYTNTTTMTLDVDSVGGVTVKNMLGGALVGGEVASAGYSEYLYDSTNWILVNLSDFRKWTPTLITATTAAWPVVAGTKELVIELWGAGGGGGGLSSATQRGSGGGGAAYVYKYYAGTMDATLAVTVGSAGASGTTGAGGGTGGDSIVVGANLGTLTAGGGEGGDCVFGGAAGGVGGTPSGGDLNIQGGDGYANTASALVYGFGGDAPRGGMGGKNNVGVAGLVPGGGGAGENHIGGGSGPGGAGRVLIWVR